MAYWRLPPTCHAPPTLLRSEQSVELFKTEFSSLSSQEMILESVEILSSRCSIGGQSSHSIFYFVNSTLQPNIPGERPSRDPWCFKLLYCLIGSIVRPPLALISTMLQMSPDEEQSLIEDQLNLCIGPGWECSSGPVEEKRDLERLHTLQD